MKVELKHPVTHNGDEYSRGVHDVSDALAKKWLKEAPHAVTAFAESEPAAGTVVPAADTAPLPVSHTLNVPDTLALIDDETDIDKLHQMADDEARHPKFTNGRNRVLTAISERITELTTHE